MPYEKEWHFDAYVEVHSILKTFEKDKHQNKNILWYSYSGRYLWVKYICESIKNDIYKWLPSLKTLNCKVLNISFSKLSIKSVIGRGSDIYFWG